MMLSPPSLASLPQSFIASADRHQTCLPSWRKESFAGVCARYVSSEIFWGSKTKLFLVTFASASLYKTTFLRTSNWKSSVFLSCCKERNEKRPVLSIEVLHPATCRLLLMQGQTVLKVHGNLNKGALGSMKLN